MHFHPERKYLECCSIEWKRWKSEGTQDQVNKLVQNDFPTQLLDSVFSQASSMWPGIIFQKQHFMQSSWTFFLDCISKTPELVSINECLLWWLNLREAIHSTAHPHCPSRCITLSYVDVHWPFWYGELYFMFELNHFFLFPFLAYRHHFLLPATILDRYVVHKLTYDEKADVYALVLECVVPIHTIFEHCSLN